MRRVTQPRLLASMVCPLHSGAMRPPVLTMTRTLERSDFCAAPAGMNQPKNEMEKSHE